MKDATSIIIQFIYFLLAVVQVAAVYTFFAEHLDWWFVFAAPVAFLTGSLPVVGSIMGIYAAHKVWGLSLFVSCMIFLWPYMILLALIVFMLIGRVLNGCVTTKKD